MAFKEQITQLSTSKTNHADNFNQIFNELHDNGKYLKKEIESNDSEISALQNGKVDGEIYQLDKQAQARKDSEQDSILTALKKDKLENTYFEEYKVQQTQKNTEQDKRMETIETDAQKETERINTKIDNKIGMNEVFDDTNFNFIRQNVEQNGLIEFLKDNIIGNTTVIVKCNQVYTNDWVFMHAISTAGGYGVWNDFAYGLKINYANGTTIKTLSVWNKSVYDFAFTLSGNIATFYNDELGTKQVILDGFVDKNAKFAPGTAYKYNYLNAYNRILTPQEIHHNLSVLNNSPSINELRTTDSEGKTSISCFGSDEDHVEMSTGRTLREEYMGVLKTMGKEFVSADGSNITVNNGIEARVISGEIKGQTVKSLICNDNLNVTLTGKDTIALKAYTSLINSGYVQNNIYTLVAFVTENTCNKGVVWNGYGTVSQLYWSGVLDFIPGGFVGVKKLKLQKDTAVNANHFLATFGIDAGASGTVKFTWCILDGDYTTKDLPINSVINGLSSTQAIISNNGQQYHIYESMILGKTRILDANGNEVPAGTAGARLVSLEPTDSSLPKLGSVPSVSDVVDRHSMVASLNTTFTELTGNETITKSGQAGWNIYYVEGVVGTKGSTGKHCVISNVFEPSDMRSNMTKTPDKRMVCLTEDGGGVALQFEPSIATVEQVKSYLKQQKANSTPVEIRYQSVTPKTIQLTDKQMEAYDKHKKLISLGGVGGAYDTLEIKEDGSGVYTHNTKEIVLNGSENWQLESSGITKLDTTAIFGNLPESTDKIRVIGDMYKGDTWNNGWVNDNIVFMHPNGGLFIRDTSIATLEGFIDKLKQNNLTIMGNVAIPIVTHIPKEIMPTILTHKTNIWEVGGAVAASSYKIVQPIDKNAEQDAEIKDLKDKLNTVMNVLYANPLLVDAYINQEVQESQKTIKERMM